MTLEMRTVTMPVMSQDEKTAVGMPDAPHTRQAFTPDVPRRRVFFLVDSFNVGGTETQAVELALRLDPALYDITLGCLKREGPLLERLNGSAIEVLEFHPNGGFDSPGGVYQLLRMSSFLRKGGYQVMHAHDLWSNLIGVPAAKMAGVPVIVSSQRDLSHDPWYRTARGRLLRALQRRSSAVLTNAGAIRDGLVEQEGFSPAQVKVIRNGVDVERFASASRDRESLFPGTSGEKLIVLVGNMHTDVKGQPTLIAAAPSVLQQFPRVRFVFVGDGDRKKDFQQSAVVNGVAAKFIFCGARRDIPQILTACDIAVLPSAAEGMPNAVLEYLAAGLPTIASSVGGNLEVIQDGVTGLLVPPGNAHALATALTRVLGDTAFASRLAQSGQRFVRDKFSFESLTRNIDNLY